MQMEMLWLQLTHHLRFIKNIFGQNTLYVYTWHGKRTEVASRI